VPKAGAEPIEERAFLLRGKTNDSGNLKGFLRTAGRKFDQDAVIWKGEDRDVVLFALKEWPAFGLLIGDKKNLWTFPAKWYRAVSRPHGKRLGWSIGPVG
jgi:hypothetical protein